MEIILSKEDRKEIVNELKIEFGEMFEEALEKAISFQFVDRKQLALMLSVCESTISTLEKEGLPHSRFGKSVRYDIRKIQDWIDSREE